MKKAARKTKTTSKTARSRSSKKFLSMNKRTAIIVCAILLGLIITLFAVQQQQNLVQEAARRDDCVTDGTGRNARSNADGGGSGKDGTATTSNQDGTFNIGKINSEGNTPNRVIINGEDVSDQYNSNGSSTTKVIINGKDVTDQYLNTGDLDGTTVITEDNFVDGQDINTGGKTGGNNKTEINIDRSGKDQTVDKSGTDGNSGSGNVNLDDCDRSTDNRNTNRNTNRNSRDVRNNASQNRKFIQEFRQSILCRIFPSNCAKNKK